MPFAAVEDHDLAAARAAHHAFGTLARAFGEDLHALADERAVAVRAKFVREREEALVAFVLHFLRQLIRHVRRRGVFAFRVAEDVGVVEIRLAIDRQRLLEVLLRLAGEAHDDVRGDAHVRLGRAQLANDGEKPLARVAAVHGLQHPVAAALERNVRALHELRQARVGLDEIVAVAFRMR